ncbi:MAG: NAD-binding protein [Candidatus Micrarchaeaceae archaeon]
MAETGNGSYSIATRAIVILLIVAALLTVASIAGINLITHNVYVASYYTISALFDANSQGAPVFIAAALKSDAPYVFYEFIVVSLLDGLAKAVIIGLLIAAFISLLSSIDLKSRFEIITAKHLKGHVIVCGYSMLAERLCNDMMKDGIHFVIIDKSPEKVNLLHDLKFNVIEGDFTDRKVLHSASMENARAIVFATESDFINLLGIITSHHINPDIKIISRARSESTIRKMQRGGTALCLVPEIVAGIELGERISKM